MWNSVIKQENGVHEYGWRTMVTNKYYEWVTC